MIITAASALSTGLPATAGSRARGSLTGHRILTLGRRLGLHWGLKPSPDITRDIWPHHWQLPEGRRREAQQPKLNLSPQGRAP